MNPRGKAAGTRVEHKVLKVLRETGWWCFRTPASLGVCDIVALRAGHLPRLIEVKSTTRSAFAGFPPMDRLELIAAAEAAGAHALLAYWPPRGELRMIPSYDWPPPSTVNTEVDRAA